MALQVPFVRFDYERQPRHSNQNGSFYYVSTGGGLRETIGRSIDRGRGHLVYRRDYNFVRTYAAQFPLGSIEEWDDYPKFTRWIESVMYFSFLRSCIAGVPHCWFLKRLSSLYSPEGLPLGLQGFFPAENVTTWIVIRHGYRVWPILVVGRMMFNNNWNDLCRVHNLRIGCRVVFGCERRWVFSTFLFDENGKEMTYAWTNPYDPLQQLDPVPDHLRTACLPSIFEHEASLVRFLCEYTTEDSLRLLTT